MSSAAFDLNTFFNSLNRNLEPNVKSHLKYVYSSMTMALLAASIGSYVHIYTSFLSAGFLSFVMTFGFALALIFTPHDYGKNNNKRLLYLNGFAFSSGLNMGPLLNIAIIVNPSIIPIAFVSTSVIFISFTLSAIFGDKRRTLYLGGLLMSGLSLMIMMSLVNIFIGSKLIYQTYLYLSLFVMSGFVIYDTAIIIEKRKMGDDDFIWHSILLFIDFIDIFRHLVVLLIQKEERRDRRRNK